MSTLPHIGDDEKLKLARAFPIIDRYEKASPNGAKVDLCIRFFEALGHGFDVAFGVSATTLQQWYPGSPRPDGWAETGSAPSAVGVHIGDDEKLLLAAAFPVIDAHERVSIDGAKVDLCIRFFEALHDGASFTAAFERMARLLAEWYPGSGRPDGWPDAPPPVTLTRLSVDGRKRWFTTEAGFFDYREVSAFSLLSRLLAGETDYVREYLAAMRGYGFTVVRVILTLDGDYWVGGNPLGRSFRCAPDMPGYWQGLDRLADLTAEAGLYLRAVFVGAVEPFGGVWHSDRRDVWSGSVRERGEAFVVEAAQRLAGRVHVIGELANEPGQIGMRESFDELIALGRKVKAVAPLMLLGGGAVDGPNDNDTRLCVQPFDYVDAHIERRMGVGGFEWVKRSGEYATIDAEHQPVKMPFISGEPVNFGEWRADDRNGDVERSPSVAFAYGGVSRARQYNTCFHYDGGLWTTMPELATVESIRAYMAALDAFPMLTDDKWRGHWSQSYWRQVWPAKDDIDVVERHLNERRGPWRVFGCGPYCIAFPSAKDWNWQADLTSPAQQLASSTAGVYGAGIYRKD